MAKTKPLIVVINNIAFPSYVYSQMCCKAWEMGSNYGLGEKEFDELLVKIMETIISTRLTKVDTNNELLPMCKDIRLELHKAIQDNYDPNFEDYRANYLIDSLEPHILIHQWYVTWCRTHGS